MPARVGEQCRTMSSSDIGTSLSGLGVLLEDALESSCRAAVAACNGNIHMLDFIECIAQHFVRYGICKKNQQVGTANLVSEAVPHLGEYLCLAFVFTAYIFIAADHTVVSADDYYTHKRLLSKAVSLC